jgi:hypothetical protein
VLHRDYSWTTGRNLNQLQRYIYNCSSLENTDLDSTEFRHKNQVKTIRSPIYIGHSSLDHKDIQEYEDLVISSYSFTTEDIEEMHVYSWYMLSFHHLGVLNYIAKYAKVHCGIDYLTIYDKFKAYCSDCPDSLFGKEYAIVKQYVRDGYAGKGWNHIDLELGPIVWPIDEATWLRVTANKVALRNELRVFCNDFLRLTGDEIDDLIKFQVFTLSDRNNQDEYIISAFDYDWVKYWKSGQDRLDKNEVDYRFRNKMTTFENDFKWNTMAIWFGRRKLNYKAKLEEIDYHG